ncbi:hypothetical protein F4556_006817 [Kitasatospora gansuensis]|uniref:GH18 domain-containing protein n=1 Tax=Kitasatospora gansuensis TaxID=258050 RepID=A0A7W7WKX7_9ACTN|nr:glycosyl hydrolase family 18 protein [Kitasatospora gansuensis]MBB4951282.1 hypothetical protein [Kitasatospora gansuensis]
MVQGPGAHRQPPRHRVRGELGGRGRLLPPGSGSRLPHDPPGVSTISNNARNAQITSWSPLLGTYTPGDGTTVGTFESGRTEWFDILTNHLGLEYQGGRNGFVLFTDLRADADYLYNPQSQVFISLDTPRTVRAKAQYAAERQLGGLFIDAADADNGLLSNAAREGLGAKETDQVIDMAPYYFTGETTAP